MRLGRKQSGSARRQGTRSRSAPPGVFSLFRREGTAAREALDPAVSGPDRRAARQDSLSRSAQGSGAGAGKLQTPPRRALNENTSPLFSESPLPKFSKPDAR